MSASVLRAYRNEVLFNIPRAAYTFQTVAKAVSAWTEYVPLIPRAGDENVLGVVVEAITLLTASAAQAVKTTITVGTTTTALDVLDEAMDQVQVAPSVNTQARSYSTSRMFQEEVERQLLDVTGFAYPRTAPASFAASGSRTDTGVIFIPVGGNSGAVRFHVPPITNVFAANVTSSVVFQCYVISGDNSTVPTFLESVTGNLGAAKQDISTYYPANLAPTLMGFMNETTTTLTNIYQTSQDKDILLDQQDAAIMSYANACLAPETVAGSYLAGGGTPSFSAPAYNVLWFAQNGKRFKTLQVTFGTAGVRDIGFIEIAGEVVVNPPVGGASTPAPSTAKDTGTVGVGGYPAPRSGHGSSGGTSNVRRVGA